MRPARKGLLLPALAVLALLGLEAPKTAGQVAASGSELPIWVIGDSIGVGVAAAIRRHGMALRSDAVVGWNTAQTLTMLQRRGFEWPIGPRFIIVSLGTNDGAQAIAREDFDRNARRLVDLLRSRGHVVCWLLPPSEKSRVPSTVNLERLTAQDIKVLGLRVPMADAWHPTAAGYDELARAVLRVRAGA